MIYVLGIDPGLTGAIAYFKMIEGEQTLMGIRDMPVMANPFGKGKTIDCAVLAELLSPMRGDRTLAIIERVSAMPTDGSAHAFKFGKTAMAPEALCAAYQIPIHMVMPGVWKRAASLIKKPKGVSLAKAKTMWPDKSELFRLKKHEGRAEAALIGWHGLALYRKAHGEESKRTESDEVQS